MTFSGPLSIGRGLRGRLVLEVQVTVALEVVCNIVHVEERSLVEWINVLIARQPVLHRFGEGVPVDLFKLIIREDPAGPKRVLEATTMFAEFSHAMEYIGRFFATTVLLMEVHVLELLVHILPDLVP